MFTLQRGICGISSSPSYRKTLGNIYMWVKAVWKESGEEMEGTIPANWVDEKHKTMMWPSDDKNAMKAYKKKEKPSSDWLKFELVKVKFRSEKEKECKSYELTTAAESSEGDEDSEEQEKCKRFSKKKVDQDYVEDFDSNDHGSSEDEDAPAAKKSKVSVFPKPPAKVENEIQCNGTVSSAPRRSLQLRSPSPSVRSSKTSASSSSRTNEASNERHRHSSTPRRSLQLRSPSPSAQSSRNDVFPLPTAKYQKRVINLLLDIRQEMRRGGRNNEQEGASMTIKKITNLEDFNQMEQALLDANTRQNMVKQVSKLGGDNVKKNVHNVFERLFHNKVLAEFNFSGINRTGMYKKRAFDKTIIYTVIIDAVLLNHATGTHEDVKKATQKYLQNAPFLGNGGGKKN